MKPWNLPSTFGFPVDDPLNRFSEYLGIVLLENARCMLDIPSGELTWQWKMAIDSGFSPKKW